MTVRIALFAATRYRFDADRVLLDMPMKRVALGLLYVAGALSLAYLAIYAYAMLTHRNDGPGEPIKIFRKDDAPNYS